MKKILYIDDRINSEVMDSRLDIIRDIGVDIIKIDSVDKALKFINNSLDTVSLIVLDIIIPPLDVYSTEETNGGTTTGLRLLKDIRAKNSRIPIIIVSIKQKENLEGIDLIMERYNVASFSEIQKASPEDIGEIIKSIILK